MGRVKGTGWKGNIEYLMSTYDEAAVERVRESLSQEDHKKLFGQPLLPTSWVDYGANTRFLLLADQMLGHGDGKLVRDAAAHNARKDLQGVYKAFLGSASPQAILDFAPAIWSQYYDQGTVSVERLGDSHCLMKVVDFADIPLHHEIAHLAFMEEAMQLCGATAVTGKHPQCIARGNEACLFEIRWK